MHESKIEWLDQLIEAGKNIVDIVSPYWWGIVAFLGLLVLLKLMSRMGHIRSGCRDIIKKRYEPGEIITHDNGAFCLGLQSEKGGKIRGRGVLVLTSCELFFVRLHPVLELAVPVKNIERVTTPESFLNVSANGPLLQVQYSGAEGKVEIAAWKLTRADVFVEALKKQRKKLRARRKK